MLILGGARSGKSVTAERLLAVRDQVDYVATGPVPDAADPEWADRVRLHQQRRPAHWTTLETLDLENVLSRFRDGAGAGGLPVDLAGGGDGGSRAVGGRPGRRQEAGRSRRRPARRVAVDQRHVVAVSNEVGSGVVPATESGIRFRDELGVLNARVAAECEQVWLCTAGIARRLR